MPTLSIDASDLKRLGRELDGMIAKLPVAIARGLNEAGDKVRTKVRAAMLEQTSLIRLKSVTSRSSTVRAFAPAALDLSRPYAAGVAAMGGGLAYIMVFRGKPTRIDEFRFSVGRGRQGRSAGPVSAIMWGVQHTFERSFRIKGRSGWKGLRARVGEERLPIRGFDGPNLAKEAVKGKVAEAFHGTASAVLGPIVEKHMAKLLK